MKISVFSIPQLNLGKHSVRDPRLDEVDKISRAKKKTYIQVELVGEDDALDADSILAPGQNRADLILKDLEFVETRLDRAGEVQEKALLEKLKAVLEKENFVAQAELSEEERRLISGYNLLTHKPVVMIEAKDLEDVSAALKKAVSESGFISFFTTGEKETRAWLIKNGLTAWDAAGVIHSDMQRGFIRAEIISFTDFIQCGGETAAKQQGKLRLEQKEYVMQDADLVNFRFSK